MAGSTEIGALESLKSTEGNRCRPYNKIAFTDITVTKSALTDEGRDLLDKEIAWYREMKNYDFDAIPKILSYSPLIMERIDGDNIFKADLDDRQKRETIDRLVAALHRLHACKRSEANTFDLQETYYSKTMRRIRGIREAIPFNTREYITINGVPCKNVFFFHEELQKKISDRLYNTEFGPIHGDCTLTNTMIDRAGRVYFIDARGYFGKTAVVGDVYYDWAKLYYSISGRFDRFNIKDFDLTVGEDGVTYEIGESGWECLDEYYLSSIENCDRRRIMLIHAIIWLSMSSHAWEDFDSMCLAFYNGLRLLRECEEL
jgi:aminoglycoside phosphotransferase